MNKLRFRIVFNKNRGMWMAVPETARSQGKAVGQGAVGSSAHSAMRLPALRRIALLVGAGLGAMVFASGALAQIVADPKAPGEQRATVLNAANGVLQVNIQTTSAAGVSRNVYSQFDIPKSGTILNNSRANVQTQLGGWVHGNPWLNKGTARVILGEVNSGNPSRLQGYIEVAGDRAETIIANPAGIVVDGGGFINVSRATLTTGSPILEDGRLKGYSVQQGRIVIDGDGLDASKTDYTALITRSLQVNAELWAQRLTVITGVNQVEEAAQANIPQSGQASGAPPQYAVDVGRLGGMYANHIYLLGTEAGVGVRNAGGIGAAAGDLVVTASGRLENTGTLSASHRLQANANSVDNHGNMKAGGTLALTTGSLVNTGQMHTAAEALITVQDGIDNHGGRIEAARLDLTGATLRNTQGRIVQTGSSALAVDALQAVNAAGTLGQANLLAATGGAVTPPNANSTSNAAAQDAAEPRVGVPTIPAQLPALADGRLQVQLLDNTSGVITTNGNVTLQAGVLDNRGGEAFLSSLSVTGSAFNNTGGTLTVLRDFKAHTDSFVNDQGKLLIGAAFDGGHGSFSNRQGLLQAGQLAIDVTRSLDNSSGILRQLGSATAAISVAGELALDASTLSVAAGLNLRAGSVSGDQSVLNVVGNLDLDAGATSAAQGKWIIGGDAKVRTGALDSSGGKISAGGTLRVDSAVLKNAGGTIAGAMDAAITVRGDLDNSGGLIQAARNLALSATGSVQNRGGSIETLAGNSTMRITGATIDNSRGRIANVGAGSTTLAAGIVTNSGVIGGNGDVEISAATLTNEASGSINAGANIRMVQNDARLNNQGNLVAVGDIEIVAAAIDNTAGKIATAANRGGQVSLQAATLENRAGQIDADGLALIEIRGNVGNVSGRIRAGGDLALSAGERIENRGGNIEAAGGTRIHGSEIGNEGGTIVATGARASLVEADRSIDNNGLIGANGQFTIKAETLHNGAQGTISAASDLDLAVRRRLANDGGIISTVGGLNFDQAGATLVNSGAMTSAGGARLVVGQLNNDGGAINILQGASLDLKSDGLSNRGGRVMVGADASVLIKDDIDNAGGVLQAGGSLGTGAGGALRNNGGVIEALGPRGTLVVRAAAIDNTGGRIVNVGDGGANVRAAGPIDNSGLIAGNGRLEVGAASMNNVGTISSGGRIELAVSSTLTNTGTISAAGALHTNQANAALRNSGTIVAGGAIEIAVKTLDNAGGRIVTAQGSNAGMLLSAQNISNQGGAIMADRNAAFSVTEGFDNRSGLVQAKGQMQLDARGLVDTSGGSIEALSADSTLQLHAGAVLNVAGRIVNAGSGETEVRADTTLVNSGQIAGKGALSLEAQSVVNTMQGAIAADAALALLAHASLENAGTISSGATLTIGEAGAALSNHGNLVANGDITIRAATIDNDGGTVATASGSGASLTLQGASLSNRGGRIVAERALTLGVDGMLDNSHGILRGIDAVQATTGGTLANDGGLIEASGAGATLAMQANAIDNGGGHIVNVGRGATTVAAAHSLESSGLVAGNGTLDLRVASLVNEAAGTLASRGALTALIRTRMDNSGTVNSGATLDIAAQAAEVRNGGQMVASGALALTSATFNNDGGKLATATGSGADLQVDAASISNRGGAILSDRDLRMNSADAFDNTQGALQAAGSLQLSVAGAVGNNGGVIEALDSSAHLNLHAGTLDNGKGRIVNVGAGATAVTVDGKLSNRGVVAANGSVDLAAAALDNQAGASITAGTTLDIVATSSIGNAGEISSNGAIRIGAAGAAVRNIGQIVSGTSATLETAFFDNSGGQLFTLTGRGGDIVLHAGDVANVGGTLSADGAAQITSAGTLDNRRGTVRANTAISIDAVGMLRNQEGVLEAAGAGATLDLRARSVDNSAGRLVNAGTGASRVAAIDGIVNSGTLAGNGTVELRAGSLQNRAGGTVAAGGTLDLHVSQALDNGGTLSAAGALRMNEAAARIINNGQIVAADRIALHGGSIANDDGHIVTLAGAEIVLRSESTLSNRAGVIAAGNVTVSAQGMYDNSHGLVQTPGRLQAAVGGSLTNVGGALEAAGAASTLALQAESIENTAGRIVNTGTGQTNIDTTGGVVNSGTIAGNGALALSARSLQNTSQGAIGAGGALELAVHEQLANAGIISSGANLHSDQAAASFSNTGRISAGGAIDITAHTLGNRSGQLYTVNNSGAAINLHTGSLDNTDGTVSADGLLQAKVGDNAGNGGGTLHGGTGARLEVGGALANGSGTIEVVAGALELHAASVDSSGRIVNAGAGATTIGSTTDIVNGGTIAGNGALAISAQTLQSTSGGTIRAVGALELALRQQLVNAGTITSGATLRFNGAAASLTNTGHIGAGGHVDITAAAISNRGGLLYTANDSGAAISLRTGSLDNMGGTVFADDRLRTEVRGSTSNSGGILHGGTGATLEVGGALANGSGTIEAAAGTLTIQALSVGSGGRIVNAGTGATTIGSTTDIINSGTIAGNGALVFSAQTLQNAGSGTIGAGGALDLEVCQQLGNAGTITSAETLHFGQAAASFSNTGRIGAGGIIDVTAAAIQNNGGQLYTVNNSGAAINLRASVLDNTSGTVAAGGLLLAEIGGTVVNSGGVLHGGTGAAMHVGDALANGSGTIEVAAGTLAINARSVTSSGRIISGAAGATVIDSTTTIVNSGTIAGNGALALSAQTLQNTSSGAISTGAALDLTVRQQLSNAGTISSGGTFHFDEAAASLTNSGRISAGGSVDITAATIGNHGQLYSVTGSGSAINLHAGSLDNTGGTVAADGLLHIEVGSSVNNSSGILHGGGGTALDVGGALANGTGTIAAAAGTLAIRAQSVESSGRIINAGTGQMSIDSATAILNGGTIAGNGAIVLHASALQNQAGSQITAGGALLLNVREQLSNSGAISSAGTLSFEQAVASFANSGQIAAAGDMRLTTATFDNSGGQISTVRGSGADITVTTSALSNRGGAILADRNATFSFSAAADNSQGTLQAGANLALTTPGNISNGGGVIETLGARSSLTLQGAAIDNGSGRISNAGSGDTRLLSQSSISNGGTIAGIGNVLLSGQTLLNQAGATIASGDQLALAITRELSNQGKINSAGTLNFDQAGATFTSSGEVYTGGNAVINASVVNNDGGHLGTGSASGADLTLTSQQLSNQGGRIATDRDLVLNTHMVTAMGELFGGRDLTLAMDGDYVQNDTAQKMSSNRNLSLSVSGNITNNSTFAAAGTLTLSGQQISNQAGASIEGKDVILKASGSLNNAGEINGTNTVDISAANVINSSGIVGGNVTVATANLSNSGAAALIGATGALDLGVAGTLNNTGGATLYSSGDIAIGGRGGGSADAVNNISSTIEAVGGLAIAANTLSNVRENVEVVKVKTVDETVHMSMPSWYQYGENHNAFETSAANYVPHEVYFVSPSDILEDQVYVTPDGYTIHRAVIRTHANDSAFYIAASGLSRSYGEQSRLTLSEGTRIIYYTENARVANPDQGAPAGNAIVHADSVTHWGNTVSFSSQYGNCSSDCIRLITQPDYTDPRTTILRDTMRALAPVKAQLEVSRDAHHAAVEDQLAAGAGAKAQILSGANMHLTVASAFENRFGDIKAKGSLTIDGGASRSNVGATLYRTHTFDGTWRTYGGQTVSYQQPTISEVIGSAAGIIEGGQGVSISGRSFRNVDITAGTVGNIRDAVNVIGSGVAGASSAGGHVAANVGASGAVGAPVSVDAGANGTVGVHVVSGAGANGTVGAQVAAGTGVGGTAGEQVSGSATVTHVRVEGAVVATAGSGGLSAGRNAAASGVANRLQVGGEADGSGYANQAAVSGGTATSGAANNLVANGTVDQSGARNYGRLSGKVSAALNDTSPGNVLISGTAPAGQQAIGVQGTPLGSVTRIAPGGLFVRNPDANSSYLYETRPQFANAQQWTSSDYLLKQLELDPATTQKRLGDGFYEQRLVREQLAELTGHAPDRGASDDGTYQQLLTNAASFAQAFQLRPGVALSAEQVARLTSDIVWMESQMVMLPDGSTETVLVPKVYLAHVGQHALQPGGALVTGNGVTINSTESIVNSGGVIDGGNSRTLLVAAQDIVNRGGMIKGGSVALAADRDIRNQTLAVTETYDFGQNSGSHTSLSNRATITATGALDIMAGRELSDVAGKISAGSATLTAGQNISFDTVHTGSTYQSQISGYSEKDSSITHQLSQISTGGDLTIAATGDLNLMGTQVLIGTAGSGTGKLLAGRTINIAAVTNEVNSSVQNDPHGKQYDKQVHQNQTLVGAGVASSGSLTVSAGLIEKGAINITGSALDAADALKLRATDSVSIVSAQEIHLADTASTRTSGGLLKSKTSQQADYVASSQAIGSALSGKTVDISAGKDINVLGSAIAGEGDVSLAAVGSVNIGASTSTLTEQHHTQLKESGFLSGGGFGISYGSRTTTTDQSRDATMQSGQSRSMVGSIDGNLNVNAGDALKISGGSLSAGQGMSLTGKSVAVTPGADDANGTFTSKMTQDGFTLAIGGSVVNAIQTAQSMGAAAGQTSNGRLKALAAAAAAMTAKDAVQDLEQKGPSAKISLTVGHSESESTEVTASRTHGGSVLAAGNDVTISATGGGKASNIDIVGSDVRAAGDVLLIADNQVNLLAARDSESQHSQSKSSSAALGVAAELSSSGPKVGYTASASASRGNVDGEGTTLVNTHMIAGDRLTIASGGDTNLKGAVASGSQVVADVKGDLNIESLQDTAALDGKRQSVSVSGTLGAGAGLSASVSQSKVHNDYASVQEQSGIRAGDGGFQLQVAGNTDLKGGVISSSEQAIKDGRNSLATATLSSGDIQNRDSTQASGVSLGLNVGKNQSGDTFSPSMAPGIGQVSGSQGSVTRSGVSGAAPAVSDQQAGQAVPNLNRDVSTGKDMAQALNKGWNGAKALDEVGAQMQITSAAMPRLAKEIGDYAKTKMVELNKQGKAEEAAKWAEGGIYRVAAHAALGAMGGGLGGAVGAAASAEAAPTLAKLQGAVQGKLADAGLSNDAASVAAKLIAGGAAAAIGGVVGAGTGAAMGLNADVNNRQLHSGEMSLAKRLADRSGGKYSAKQIEDAMRAGGNSALSESVTTGMVVPLTKDTPAGAIYDTEGMRLVDDGAGHSFLVQQVQSYVDPGLAAFIQKNTGGAQSPYAWEPSVLGIVPKAVSVEPSNPFTPNAMGCITAECAAGILGNRNHAAGETQVLGGLQAAAGSAQAMAGGTLVATGLAACAETFGAGCVVAAVGGFQVFAGLDNVNAGAKTAGDAKAHTTTGGELLQKAGLSPEGAEMVYGGLQFGTGYGAVKLAGGYDTIVSNVRYSAPSNADAFKNAARIEGSFYRDGSIVDIGEHFGKFEDGASLLAPADIVGKYPVMGRADGLFVSSPDYISSLLKRTGGDNTLIKAELGIEPQYWNGPLVRIDIANPLGKNPRLPSGLENGANSLFIRGGFTPSGAPEIVIDPIPIGSVKKVPVITR